MEIILTHDVGRLGVADDVVTTKDGYGRSYLIPRGYTVRWTKDGQEQVDRIVETHRRHAIQSLNEANAIQEALQTNVLKIVRPTGENGRLFGSVTNVGIAEVALATTNKKVNRHTITLVSSIKSTGSYKAATKFRDDVVTTISIEVVAERKKKK